MKIMVPSDLVSIFSVTLISTRPIPVLCTFPHLYLCLYLLLLLLVKTFKTISIHIYFSQTLYNPLHNNLCDLTSSKKIPPHDCWNQW